MISFNKLLDFLVERENKSLFYFLTYILNYKKIKKDNNRLLSEFYINWLIDEDKKIIFFNNPKVACTSLMVSMFKCTDVPDKDSLVQKHMFFSPNMLRKLPENMEDYYKFGFVRNPFARLVSYYENRYENNIQKDNKMQSNVKGYLKEVKSFENLVEKISKIPDFLLDPHFALQYPIFYREGKCLVDFVGKFETVESDYKPIQEKYDFLPLPHYNKTDKKQKWQDFYTIKSAKLVYKKYKKDFELFGYDDEYHKLIEYLNNKK